MRTPFFPDTAPDDWVPHEAWMKPHAMDAEIGNLTLIMQAFLVRMRHHNILVDTCVDDYKPRPSRANWHMQARGTVPAHLAAAGMQPEQIDQDWPHDGWVVRIGKSQSRRR